MTEQEPPYTMYSILPELLQLYQLYLYDLNEQAQDTLPSSPPSFEGFMLFLTTLYEI